MSVTYHCHIRYEKIIFIDFFLSHRFSIRVLRETRSEQHNFCPFFALNHLDTEQEMYTQSQKNCNIFEVAFLLEKSVYQWIWGHTSFQQPMCKFLMTLGHTTLTLGPRKNPRRKVALLLRLSVEKRVVNCNIKIWAHLCQLDLYASIQVDSLCICMSVTWPKFRLESFDISESTVKQDTCISFKKGLRVYTSVLSGFLESF